jgi:hypothetical protein
MNTENYNSEITKIGNIIRDAINKGALEDHSYRAEYYSGDKILLVDLNNDTPFAILTISKEYFDLC